MTLIPRSGITEVSRQLIERGAESVDVFGLAISDALRAAGMTETDSYYVRVTVIELPEGCENWPWEGASDEA